MKANVPKFYTTKQMIKKEVAKEYDARYKEHQLQIQTDIASQLTAIFLYTMKVNYGFGAKRLRQLFNDISSTCEDMNNGCEFVGKFDCTDLIKWVKKYADIDLKKEIETELI